MNPAPRKYLPALTGVRFLAALFVFLFHYRPFRGSDHPALELLSQMCYQMFTGVGMFFVLSGFLICYTYYSTALLKKNFLKNYFIRRAARILPVFIILTTVYFVYAAVNCRSGLRDAGLYLLNITLLKGFFPSVMYTGLVQAWTLTIEETFYFLAPLIFIIHRRYKLLFLQAMVLLSLGLVYTLSYSFVSGDALSRGLNFFFLATFFGRCFEFFVGMKLAVLLLSSPAAGNKARPRFPLATTLSMAAMLCYLFFMSRWHVTVLPGEVLRQPVQVLANNFIFPLIVACFFYGLIYERSWVQRFFASGPVELLGKSSYAFYLIHIGLIGSAVHGLTNRTLVTLLLLQALAILIFLLVERPLYRLITARHCTVGKKNIILAAS